MARMARPGRPTAYAGSDSDDSGPAPARRGRGRPPSDDSSADEDASFGPKSKQPAGKMGKARKEGQENVPPAGVNGAKRRLSGKGVGEKRRSLAAVATSPPSTPVPANRVVSSMARPGGVAALAKVREAGNGSFLGNTSGTPSRLVVSKEVMNTNYEEWMKMATDNKINAQNTWSFALIDYFHDMSLLRNSEAEGGINFQKASCTLDGCVKIWTSRVDSVAVETGKLLSGLAEDAANPAAYGDGDSDVGGGDGDEAEGGRPKRQRAPRTQGSTLVDFNEKIKVKVLDLEFTVDPLFKKTSADFDEGGAAGILMNHLSIDGEMRVVFDAGDATLVDDENDDEAGADDTLVDVTKLKESFLPPLDELATRSLCPSLSSFKFSTSDSAGSFDIAALKAAAADDGPVPTPADGGADGDAGDRSGDFFDGQPDFVGGGAEDFFAGAGMDEDEDDENGGGSPGRVGMALGGVEAFDPARAPHERDIVMAMQDGEAGAGMFDYFDKGFMKNWAGPEHWKLRRTIKKNDQQGSTAPRQRKEKQPFSIDFEGEPAQTRKELFATGTVSTTLPRSKAGRRSRSARGGTAETEKAQSDHTLPDDMHFNSQQLLRLFLKPKYVVNMRRRGPVAPEEGDIDENFWAQQAAAAQADAAAAGATAEDDDGAMAIPFATQFFNDEGDDVPDFEEEYDNPVGDDLGPSPTGDGDAKDATADEEDDLIAATKGELKRARPEFVNYAKRAKRVDVKKLKENIWRELETLTKDVEKPKKDGVAAAAPEKQAFTQVLGGLRRLYPRDKMEEISTSFCFICLLHLANEKGLRIQGDATKLLQDQDEDGAAPVRGAAEKGEEEQAPRFVGGLEELKIFRDRAIIGPDDEDED